MWMSVYLFMRTCADVYVGKTFNCLVLNIGLRFILLCNFIFNVTYKSTTLF